MRIRGDAGQGRRLDASPWRDPRLIIGVVLVLACAVLGGWMVESADDTSSYWATRTAVRAGDPVRSADLVAVRAKVPRRTAEALLRTERALPGRLADLRWASDVRRGTLITDGAFTSRRSAVELPVAVSASGVPGDLRRGDRVDVWAVADSTPTPEGEPAGAARARRILTGVTVLSRTSVGGIGGGPGMTVVVDVADTNLDDDLMGALSTARLTVVRVP